MLFNWGVAEIIKKESTVVLSNRVTRRWIEISKKSYDFILLNHHYPREEFCRKAHLELGESIKSVVEFIDKLIEYEFIVDKIITEQRLISIYITNRCNLYCKYCYRSASIQNHECLDYDKIEYIFEKMANTLNCRSLVLTGGEPLMHPRIYDILKLANKFFGNILMQTNGTLINENNIYQLAKYIKKIRIGLDGATKSTNDYYRGEGTFEKILNGMNLVVMNKIPLVISTTIYKRNYKEMDMLKKMADNFNAEIVFTEFMPWGRGIGNENVGVKVSNNRYAYISSDIRCEAFSKKLTMDTNGDLYPCDELMLSEFLIGNILDVNSTNIYDNVNIREMLSRNVYTLSSCNSCIKSYNCNALCPAKAYRTYGKINLVDNNCLYQKRFE